MGGSVHTQPEETQPDTAAPAAEFKEYRRSQITEIRPYVVGELLSSKVSVSPVDRDAGSPKEGDMIARNPAQREFLWLVSKADFETNFTPVEPAASSTPAG